MELKIKETSANIRLLSLLLLFSLGIIWGSGYSIARLAISQGVPPVDYTLWQTIGPAIILSLLTYKNIKFNKSHLKFYIVCGLLGILIPNTNMYFASAHLPAGLLALIVNIVPIIIYPLALLTRQEKFHPWRFLGIILAVIGVLCLVLPKSSFSHSDTSLWFLWALLTPFCFALFALFINPNRPRDMSPLSLAAGMMCAASIMFLPYIIITHQFYTLHWPLHFTDKLILLEIGLSSIGYVIFFWLLKVAGPVYYSLVDGVVALTGLAWGKIIFQETLQPWMSLAVVLILSGIILVSIKKR